MGEYSDGGDDTFFDDLRQWGSPESKIAKLKAQRKQNAPAEFFVEPENRDVVRVFMRALTQWRGQSVVAGKHLLQLRSGLVYEALPTIATALRVEMDEPLLDALRVMEAEALLVHAQRQEQLLKGR
ncbi:MAG TPA: DUF1799 domain-containing protein [Tepidisphaeraceae bacterium]|nr:DUF1799 domain-containing protein [Tepidisphaeraceae bacterium]